MAGYISPAQNIRYFFEYLTIYDGLSQSVPTAIAQDRYGFIWIGTQDGLNRYDGFVLKNYFSNIHTPGSVSDGFITSIYSDSKGSLWIGSRNGLNLYDFKSESFFTFSHQRVVSGTISDNHILGFYENTDSSLWIATSNGINLFNRSDSTFVSFIPDNKYASINCIAKASDEIFWLGTRHGILLFDVSGKFFENKALAKLNGLSVNSMVVSGTYLWVGTDNGLYIFDFKTGEFVSIKMKGEKDILQAFIYTIYRDRQGHIWVGSDRGLCFFNSNAELMGLVKAGLPGNSLLNPSVRSVFQDSNGLMWVGSIGGLNKFNPFGIKFKHYKTGERQKQILNAGVKHANDLVWSILEDNQKNIWIGTRNNGLYKYPPNALGTDNYRVYRSSIGDKGRISGNTVFCSRLTKTGRILFGTDKGLNIYNPQNNSFTQYLNQPDITHSLSNNYIFAISEDRNGYFWLATMDGLSRFDINNHSFINFRNDPENSNSISDNFITHLNFDKEGKLWITTNHGLNILNTEMVDQNYPSKTKFRRFFASSGVHGSLSSNLLTATFVDKKGRIWITSSNGLNLFTPRDSSFVVYRVKDGLPSNSIYMILEDDKGFLWMSTNKGISKFDAENIKFTNYDIKNGLQSNEFNSGSAFKDHKGNMYFGGINGYNVFHPDSIVTRKNFPIVNLTSFSIYHNRLGVGEELGGRIILEESINLTDEIHLKHTENFFEFEFAAMDFEDPHQNQFAYYLENFDAEWTYSGNRNFAGYTNVPPGEYILHVKACNSDYVWNEEGIRLKIIIKPPFWMTAWFYTIFALMIISVSVLLVKVRESRLKESKRKLEREVENRTREITETQEELKHYTEFIEAIFNNTIDGIVALNPEGYAMMCNPAYEQIIGYKGSELSTISFLDLVSQKYKKYVFTAISKIDEKGKIYIEFDLLHKNGKIVSLGIAATKLEIGGKKGSYLAVARDITLKKQQEKELENYRAGLEDLVERRTIDLLEAKEKAESAERLKSSFLKNLSHEIRTPMNAIIGFSQLMEEESGVNEKLRKYVRIISNNSYQLLDLLDNIITLSKLESEEMRFSRDKVFVNDLLSELFEKYQRLHESLGKRELSLVYNREENKDSFFILSDRDKIRQIFIVLLDNAFKFTEKGTIAFGCNPLPENHYAIFYVKDTGIGIPKEKMDEIFMTFTKVEEHHKDKLYRGVGLGLSMAKHIVSRLNGQIWVESLENLGASFYFRAPVS